MHGGSTIRYNNALVAFQKTACQHPQSTCEGCPHHYLRQCAHPEHPRNKEAKS